MLENFVGRSGGNFFKYFQIYLLPHHKKLIGYYEDHPIREINCVCSLNYNRHMYLVAWGSVVVKALRC